MKKLVFICLLLVSVMANAQSVMGIRFGSSIETVKQQLEQRLGEYSVIEDNGTLRISDFTMGDFYFHFGIFRFQYDGSKSFMSEADFAIFSEINDVEYMESNRDYLYSLIKEKYKGDYLEEFTNEQGFKCYKFGTNPLDNSKVLGKISLFQAESRKGTEQLYLRLHYGPIYYIDKSSDF